MPVTVTSTTTIHESAIGFASSSPENKALSDSLLAWTESQPGFVSHNFKAEGAGPTEKTHTYTTVWETVEDYANWMTARKDREDFQARRAYNEEHGIVFTTTESMS